MLKVIKWTLLSLAGILATSSAWAGTMIDLNKAGPEQLAKLEDAGFPAGLDKAIITRRDELKGFKTPEDVRTVPGMTEELFTQLYPFELNDSIVVEVTMPPSMASY